MLTRLVYTEGAHASILFVLIVVVIAYNYGITYSLGDKTAYGGEEQMVGLSWRIHLENHFSLLEHVGSSHLANVAFTQE